MEGTGRYASAKELQDEYSISYATVHRMKDLILKNVPDRYAKDAVVSFGGKPRIRRDVFHDAVMNRYYIQRGIAPKPKASLRKLCWEGTFWDE